MKEISMYFTSVVDYINVWFLYIHFEQWKWNNIKFLCKLCWQSKSIIPSFWKLSGLKREVEIWFQVKCILNISLRGFEKHTYKMILRMYILCVEYKSVIMNISWLTHLSNVLPKVSCLRCGGIFNAQRALTSQSSNYSCSPGFLLAQGQLAQLVSQ